MLPTTIARFTSHAEIASRLSEVEWMPFWLLLKAPGDFRPQIHRVFQHVRPCLLYSDVYTSSGITCFGSSLQTSAESIMVFQGECSNLKTMIGVCKRSVVVSPKTLNWETSQCSLAAVPEWDLKKKPFEFG